MESEISISSAKPPTRSSFQELVDKEAAGTAGGSSQPQGKIVIRIGNPGNQGVNHPVDGRKERYVQGELVINIKNLVDEAERGGPEQEESNDLDLPNGHLEIYQAAIRGDWEAAKEIYERNDVNLAAPITARGETALHIAALSEHLNFVRKLVNEMSDVGLGHRDIDGNTALCFAVASGNMDLLKIMIERKEDLVMARDEEGTLPIYYAALLGHKDMVSFLYEKTKNRLKEDECKDMLVALIEADMYDMALDLINAGPEQLAIEKDSYDETALLALARKSFFLPNTYLQVCLPEARSGYFNITFSGSSRTHTMNLYESSCKLVKRICDQVASFNDKEISKAFGKGWRPIFVAAEQGNLEFLRILIRALPDLVLKTNEDGLTIFHTAVVNRQEQIFELIYEIGSFKNVIVRFMDKDDNNMLHLAGMLAPPNRLNIVPGAALQLQRELLWFEEVKNLVEPRFATARNKSNKTPQELFMDNHKELFQKGEEWMRNTANPCMIVATLIAIAVFVAALTVPGGNDQNTGFPMFLHKTLFKIFAVSVAISLIFSVTSVLTFLSILTSTYALNDFVHSLPTKLLIGLSTLFLSIAAMMVAFVTIFFVYFRHQQLLIYALPLAVVAFYLLPRSIGFHYHIFVIMIRSTYMCRSYSPFRPNYRDPLLPTAKCKAKKKAS